MRRATVLFLILGLAAGVMAGCGGGEAATTTTTTTTTTTLPPQPPCYGYEEVNEIPILGGLEMGYVYPVPTGGEFDLTDLVACGVEGGVITVTEDGVFDNAYMENCGAFDGTDLPEPMRPPTDSTWFCIQPQENGWIYFNHFADN